MYYELCISTLYSSVSFYLQEAVQAKGLRDDTTCIVVDILPQEKPPASVPQPKKPVKGMLKSMFRKKSSESSSCTDKDYLEPDVVEELFEEGSAMLAERFNFVIIIVKVSILLSSFLSYHENMFVCNAG